MGIGIKNYTIRPINIKRDSTVNINALSWNKTIEAGWLFKLSIKRVTRRCSLRAQKPVLRCDWEHKRKGQNFRMENRLSFSYWVTRPSHKESVARRKINGEDCGWKWIDFSVWNWVDLHKVRIKLSNSSPTLIMEIFGLFLISIHRLNRLRLFSLNLVDTEGFEEALDIFILRRLVQILY